MANATARVGKTFRRYDSDNVTHSYVTLSSQLQLYVGAMVGLTTGGYAAKFDDTQSLAFFGLVLDRSRNAGSQGPKLPNEGATSGTQGDGTLDFEVKQPKRFELSIASVAITDIGKTVYATFDQTGTLDPSATTYANAIGTVSDLAYATNSASPVSGVALVEPFYVWPASNARLQAAKWMAATGAQSLTRWDLGKTIFVPNSAALTLSLPPVAGCPAGTGFVIVKTTAAAQAITLDGDGAETIDGGATLATMDAQFDVATLVSDGTQWIVTSRDIA